MTREGCGARTQAPILVMKFGGTSLGTVEAIQRAAAVVRSSREDWPRTLVVVSALSGVTNLLLDTARRSADGDRDVGDHTVRHIRTRHLEAARALIRENSACESLSAEIESLARELDRLCGAVAVLGEATPRALDAVAAIGERLSVRLFASALGSEGVPASAVDGAETVVTDSNFQSAHPDLPATRLRSGRVFTPLLDRGIVPVVTGFVGANPAGVTTTLGRGGSDYSAALIAAALDAAEVWIWTDVDGVMTADPRIVPEARTIPTLSYRELAELAYFGAKVVHPMTIRPVIEAGIGLSIRNTFNPDHPGTRVVSKNNNSTEVIKAVTSIRGQGLVTIEGRGMLGVPGVAARTFAAVASTGANVILISQASSEQSICFAVPAAKSGAVVRALEEAFSRELLDRDIDRVWDSGEMVIVTVVGAGMRHTPGVAGRVFTTLGAEGVNVVAIAQGSSEVAISLVVEASDGESAVRVLHRLVGR